MKKKIFFVLISVAIISLSILAVQSMLKAIDNHKLFKLIEQNKTNEAITLISGMSEEDVNTYSLPLVLDQPISMLSQGMWSVELPLVKACENGNYEIIEALLKKGADPNKFIDGGWTPIEAVFIKRHSNRLEISKLLVEYGADVNLCGSRSPALFSEAALILWGAKDEELSNEIISFLIDNGAESVNSNNDYSILHYTAHGNSVLITNNLINNYQLPINAINIHGQTPLMMTAQNNAIDTAKLLLEHGADRSIKDNNGKTAYDLAIEAGNAQMANLLENST